MRLLSLMVLVLTCMVGCGDDDDGGGVTFDAAASFDSAPVVFDAAPGGTDAADSFCGHEGDPGNDIGVGKFCNQISDCSGNGEATICATLGDPMAHFCTKLCSQGDTDAGGICGTDATCTCGGGGCGCTPNACL